MERWLPKDRIYGMGDRVKESAVLPRKVNGLIMPERTGWTIRVQGPARFSGKAVAARSGKQRWRRLAGTGSSSALEIQRAALGDLVLDDAVHMGVDGADAAIGNAGDEVPSGAVLGAGPAHLLRMTSSVAYTVSTRATLRPPIRVIFPFRRAWRAGISFSGRQPCHTSMWASVMSSTISAQWESA